MPDTHSAMTTPAPEPLEIIPPSYVPECSKTMTKMLPALFAFQAAVDPIKKTGQNEHLHSTYADLVAVWAAIRGPLQEHGLLVLQEPHPSPRGAMVTTTVIHVESGEWRRSTLFIPARKADAQAFGSALTYCRRYSLMIVLGLNSTDDDGHAATIPPPKSTPRQEMAEPTAPRVEQAGDAGWTNWAQGKELQLQGCATEEQLINAWNGMQPELKKADEGIRARLTAVKDKQKLKLTEKANSGIDVDQDVPF